MKPAATHKYYHETKNVEMYVGLDPNESPINLFELDKEHYEESFPSIKYIRHKYSVTLNRGDCVYVPAYYFYQVNGVGSSEYQEDHSYASSVITVSLKYKVHSQLLASFYEAIEEKIL